MTNIGKLKVGRASAGSGKTFTLTVEYISLLMMNPDNYRHTLAVTFTNKATNEMKNRIVDTLYGIATNNPDADKYLHVLAERFKRTKTEKTIRETCGIALSLILHDYSHFRIETIDSFFQSIVRDLARELNLTANLRIDLNQDEALADAVHQMIERMKVGDQVYNAVLAYIQDKLNTNEKNWKIDDEVTDFSRNIFNEKYLQHEKAINEKTATKGFYAKYKKNLLQALDDIKEDHLQNAQAFIDYCELYALESSYFINGKSGVYAFLPKIAKGQTPRIPAALVADPDADWLKDEELNRIHKPKFQQMMQRELDLRKQENTVKAILRHINQMSLLGMVDATLRKINSDTNRFILADTAYKLNEIINGNDIPFIYEKAAASFKYIMIDEFQDTSELQWKNFIPLIKECIDRGCMCLIVGDVKQSIYRWRNSDWSILNNLSDNLIFKDVIDEDTLQKALGTNHRSDEQIVTFNNTFFTNAAQEVAKHYRQQFPESADKQDIKTAYHEVVQLLDPRHADSGYVSVIDLSESGQDELMLQQVVDIIQNLINCQHVLPQDIAILARTNDILKEISSLLKTTLPDVNIVSDETYQLDTSPAINTIMLALQVIASYNEEEYPLRQAQDKQSEKKPFSMFLCTTLAWRFQSMKGTTMAPDRFLQASKEQLEELLPKDFLGRIDELQVLSLYELCIEIYSIFELDQLSGQAPYIHCFMDEVTAFVDDKGTDLNAFIEFWNESLYKKTVPASSIDGIQLLTIHKSKGLEFHTVIIPYCNWNMGGKSSVLWCESDGTQQLPVIPVQFNKELHMSAFSAQYEKEEMRNYVDNLNLLYVAFTRASHNLFVLTDKGQGSFTAHDVILEATKEMELPMGTIVPHIERKTEKPKSIPIDYRHTTLQLSFRQSNRSKEFVADTTDSHELSYISKGLVVHKVFEMIHDMNDIPKVMRQLQQEGVLKDHAFADEINDIIERLMTNPTVRSWYAPEWHVMNECSIITLEKEVAISKRPDRVISNGTETIVIDYKTGQEMEGHKNQVRKYVTLLREMGLPRVQGFLWYLKDNKVVEVRGEW
jgi:ATP-dependent exoDNAse (exonuclease V) beta subunit